MEAPIKTPWPQLSALTPTFSKDDDYVRNTHRRANDMLLWTQQRRVFGAAGHSGTTVGEVVAVLAKDPEYLQNKVTRVVDWNITNHRCRHTRLSPLKHLQDLRLKASKPQVPGRTKVHFISCPRRSHMWVTDTDDTADPRRRHLHHLCSIQSNLVSQLFCYALSFGT